MPKNSTAFKIPMHQLASKKLYILLLLLGCGLFLLAGILWWRNVYASPRNVFWGMIENNLATQGVTRRTEETSQQGSTEQYAELGFGDQTLVHGVTYLRQQSPEGDSRVVTETIATKDAAYNRYTNVDTPVKDEAGESPDFSSVLGVWGKTAAPEGQEAEPAQFLADYLLGIVPFGNLTPQNRKELIRFMQDEQVFTPDYSKVARTEQSSMQMISIPASIKPAAYIEMLQKYAELSGLGETPGLDPNAYEGQPDIRVDFIIEPYSRNLRALSFPGAQGGRTEEYYSHGVRPDVSVPENSIPIEELQQKLQSIQ